ncbi:MAG: porin family protein [Gammaproteobacteria bacterium]|nr:porin family protein [Gammaproteobacteria bacterium]
MKKLLGISALTLLPLAANAGLIGGLTLESGLWQTGIDGNAMGFSIGPNVAYTHDRYFGSFGFTLGSYEDSNAQSTIGQNEIDLSVGYRVLPMASAFVGLRQTFLSYTNKPIELEFKDNITTVGAGVAVNYPLTNKLFIVGATSLGIPFASYSSDNQAEVTGNGFRTSLEAGATYRLNRQSSLNARLKGQNLVVNYDATQSSWNTSTWKLSLGLTHAF